MKIFIQVEIDIDDKDRHLCGDCEFATWTNDRGTICRLSDERLMYDSEKEDANWIRVKKCMLAKTR